MATAPSCGHGSLSYPTKETTDEGWSRTLFKNLMFFLSHGVPKDSLLFIITAFGGVVSWEGEASPFSKADESIMLQIAEEQPQSNMFPSRRYVRLTWVYDSILLQISPLSSSHQTTT